MEQLVTEQETLVENIHQGGETVVENVGKATEEIDTAVNIAYSTRRKKWWCLLICRKSHIFLVLFCLALVCLCPAYFFLHFHSFFCLLLLEWFQSLGRKEPPPGRSRVELPIVNCALLWKRFGFNFSRPGLIVFSGHPLRVALLL
jgi:hypothetical protein